jgi:hypothetical protein
LVLVLGGMILDPIKASQNENVPKSLTPQHLTIPSICREHPEKSTEFYSIISRIIFQAKSD